MAPSMPPKAGHKVTICACGANAECSPEFLMQFAIVGSLAAKKNFGIANPRVGLLNIGAEDSKGTKLQLDTYPLLQKAHEKGIINFIGNVEARDVPLGGVDVVVCDGFSGNVLIKSIEGTAMFMGSLMKHKIFKRNILSMLGYLLCKKGVDEVSGMLNSDTIGGTQFLGIKKPVIKAHGSSGVTAFRNAIRQAELAAEKNFAAELEAELEKMKETEDA